MLVTKAPSLGRPSIQRMKERHHEIARRLIAGDDQAAIAQSLGMTQSWLSIIVASPIFQIKLGELRAAADAEAADVGTRIQKLAPSAFSVLEKAIKQRPEGISPMQQVTIAQDLLDRAGHSKIQKSIGFQASALLTPEDIQKAKARGVAAARLVGQGSSGSV